MKRFIIPLLVAVLVMNMDTMALAAMPEYSSSAEVIDTYQNRAVEATPHNKFAYSLSTFSLNTSDHIEYLKGNSEGLFKPDKHLTRAEAAQILYTLVGRQEVVASASFCDVSKSSYYYDAVCVLAAGGVLDDIAGNRFRPGDPITKAEFLAMFSHFFPLEEGPIHFSDVSQDHWAAPYIASAYAKGWIKGSAGRAFKPDASLTRAEAATMTNRILSRKADRTSIYAQKGISRYSDVNDSCWAYYDILEASTRHTFTIKNGLEVWEDYESPRGFCLIDGELYYADASGQFVSEKTVGTFKFDSKGRSTTGNAELDNFVTDIIMRVTNDSMTRYEKLQAVYYYVRDNYTYLQRDHYPRGAKGWEEESALFFKANGVGNCYCFAATFMFLARRLGYDAYCVSGGIGNTNADHGWTMIRFDDGKDYMFDPGMEWSYLAGNHGSSVHYDLFKFTPETSPFIYYFP